MDYTFALRFFAIMLTLLCVMLAIVSCRRDPVPVQSVIRIDTLPRRQRPGWLARISFVCLLASVVLLMMACISLFD